MEIEVKINFDFEFAAKNMKKIMSETKEQILPNVEKQLKDNIKNFKGKPISKTTQEVRMMRFNSSTKPLIDSGRLLNSIKKTKTGISFKKYGLYQDEGYKIKSGHAFYAPSKKASFKKLFKVGGATVPAREWLHYTPTNKDFDAVFKNLMKSIRTINRTIAKKSIAF